CRYGGDEFVIILPETDRWKAEIAARRLLEKIESHTFSGNGEQPDLHLTISIGIATFPTDLGTTDSLLQRADEALYLSKSRGRNRISKDVDVAEKVVAPNLNFAGFVDRVDEVEFLKGCFNTAISGNGKFIIVNGEAGIGKTRLVKELDKYIKIHKGLSLTARPFEYGVTPPYHIFFQLIRDYMGQVGAKHIPLLGELPREYKLTLVKFIPELKFISDSVTEPTKMSPEFEKMRLFDATYMLLKILTKDSPLLMFLDDLQWVRGADLELFGYLLRNIGELPILICGAYRLEEVDDDHPLSRFLRAMSREHRYERIELGGLSYEDTGELLRSILGLKAPDGFAKKIYNETKGNPFYVEELLKSLVDDGVIFWDRLNWGFKGVEKITLPPSIGDLLLQRFENVDKELKELLTQASVIGNRFHLSLLLDLTRMNEGHLLDLLDLGVKKLLITAEPDDYYSFGNLLLERTLYENIGAIKKRRLHSKTAQALEVLYAGRRSEVYESLAYHYYNGEEWELAFETNLSAADKLYRLYATQEAAHRYEICLELLERKKVSRPGAEKIVHKGLAEVKYLMGYYDKTVEHCKAMFSRDDLTNVERAEAMLLLGRAFEQRGDYDSALASYNEAKAVLDPEEDSAEIARLILYAAQIYIRRGDHKTALPLINDAIGTYEATNNSKDLILAYNTMGLSYFNIGEWDNAYRFYQKALECSEKVRDNFEIATCLNNIGNIYHRKSELEKAIDHHKKALEIREKIGYRAGVAGSFNNLAVIYDELGEWDKCLEFHNKSLAISKSLNTPQTIALSYSNLGYLLQKMGEFEKAADYLLQSVEMLQQIGDVGRLANAKNNLSMAYLGLNWLNQAIQLLKESETASVKYDFKNILAENYWVQSSILHKQGKMAEAKDLVEKSIALSNEIGDKVTEADGYIMLARLSAEDGKWDEVTDALNKALDLGNAIKSDFIIAKSYYWHGVLANRRGEREEAEKYRSNAERLFTKLGAEKYYNFLISSK
ncbi:MAG TPA: tetratricopeptide repeat protein, partial [bacterium (Candidatus Stahlbacteria)]|nr:tetratricopeptide repeat protein [Candidatus Stahlbacteria bacterium]